MNLTDLGLLGAFLVIMGILLAVYRKASIGMAICIVAVMIFVGYYFGVPDINLAAIALLTLVLAAIIVAVVFFTGDGGA